MPNGKTKLKTQPVRLMGPRKPAVRQTIPCDAASDLYDPNDPAAVNAFWQTAIIKRGRPAAAVKRPTLNMRVDADVLEAFKATGPGWQTRINAVLVKAVRKGL
jgi:uncharacterized protein (DUF4415 family)